MASHHKSKISFANPKVEKNNNGISKARVLHIVKGMKATPHLSQPLQDRSTVLAIQRKKLKLTKLMKSFKNKSELESHVILWLLFIWFLFHFIFPVSASLGQILQGGPTWANFFVQKSYWNEMSTHHYHIGYACGWLLTCRRQAISNMVSKQ